MSDTEGTRRPVPWWVYAVAGTVLVGIVVALVLASRGGGDGDDGAAVTPSPTTVTSSGEPSGEPTATPAPSTAPTEPVPGASESPAAEPSGATPAETTDPDAVEGMFGDRPVEVAPAQSTAESSPGVTVRVARVSAVTASGTGIGEYSGPGLLVELEIENGTSKDPALDAVSVTAYRTPRLAPVASVESDDAVVPFSGTLPAGESATASYVFVSPGGAGMSVAVLPALTGSVVVFDGIAAANG